MLLFLAVVMPPDNLRLYRVEADLFELTWDQQGLVDYYYITINQMISRGCDHTYTSRNNYTRLSYEAPCLYPAAMVNVTITAIRGSDHSDTLSIIFGTGWSLLNKTYVFCFFYVLFKYYKVLRYMEYFYKKYMKAPS